MNTGRFSPGSDASPNGPGDFFFPDDVPAQKCESGTWSCLARSAHQNASRPFLDKRSCWFPEQSPLALTLGLINAGEPDAIHPEAEGAVREQCRSNPPFVYSVVEYAPIDPVSPPPDEPSVSLDSGGHMHGVDTMCSDTPFRLKSLFWCEILRAG